MKKILKYILLILIIIVGYLFLAHHLIYRKIFKANLKASDGSYNYMINDNDPFVPSLVYASLGDSLTAGTGVSDFKDSFPFLLAERLASDNKKIILKNFSYPGARTKDLIENLLTPAINSKPDIVTLLIGTNDMHGNISHEKFRENYRLIVERLSRETNAKIYLISVPLIGSETLLLPPYFYYFSQETITCNKIIKDLAKEYNANYIDICTPTAEIFKKDGGHYAADSFHPSKKGYELWVQIIYDAISQQYTQED